MISLDITNRIGYQVNQGGEEWEFLVQPVRAHDRHLRTRTCRFIAALFSPALCQVEDFSSKCSKEGTSTKRVSQPRQTRVQTAYAA